MRITTEYLEELREQKREKLKQAVRGEIALPLPVYLEGQVNLLSMLIQDSQEEATDQ